MAPRSLPSRKLFRLSSVGRLTAGFCGDGDGGGGAMAATGDGEGGFGAGGVAGARLRCSSRRGSGGSPPCVDVLGGASLLRPGEDGACWRWWWSAEEATLAWAQCIAQRLNRVARLAYLCWSDAATRHRRRECPPWRTQCRAVLERRSLWMRRARHPSGQAARSCSGIMDRCQRAAARIVCDGRVDCKSSRGFLEQARDPIV